MKDAAVSQTRVFNTDVVVTSSVRFSGSRDFPPLSVVVLAGRFPVINHLPLVPFFISKALKTVSQRSMYLPGWLMSQLLLLSAPLFLCAVRLSQSSAAETSQSLFLRKRRFSLRSPPTVGSFSRWMRWVDGLPLTLAAL